VMNLWLSPQTTVSDPASRSGMTQRGTALLFISEQPQLIDNLTNLSRAVNADIAGLKMELHSTSIPTALAGEKGADKLFDDGWMKRLEQFGYDRAVGKTPWDGDPVPYGCTVTTVNSVETDTVPRSLMRMQ